MPADEAAEDRAGHLADILRGDGKPENAAGRTVRHAVTDDGGDAGQQPAEGRAHQETQDDQLPGAGDEGLRDQQQPGDGERP